MPTTERKVKSMPMSQSRVQQQRDRTIAMSQENKENAHIDKPLSDTHNVFTMQTIVDLMNGGSLEQDPVFDKGRHLEPKVLRQRSIKLSEETDAVLQPINCNNHGESLECVDKNKCSTKTIMLPSRKGGYSKEDIMNIMERNRLGSKEPGSVTSQVAPENIGLSIERSTKAAFCTGLKKSRSKETCTTASTRSSFTRRSVVGPPPKPEREAKLPDRVPKKPEAQSRTTNANGADSSKSRWAEPFEQRRSFNKLEKKRNPRPRRSYPRISKALTIQQLQDEAACRGINRTEISDSKDDLLKVLGEGSIHLGQTKAWKEVKRIKDIMAAEALDQKDRVELQRSQADSCFLTAGQNTLTECQDKQEGDSKINKVHHVHFIPTVHAHSLALTTMLMKNGKPRNRLVCCNDCKSAWTDCLYTCEECDLDLCKGCFDYRNLSASLLDISDSKHESKQTRVLKGNEFLDSRERYQIESSLNKVRYPTICNQTPHGSNMKGYTVWYTNEIVGDNISSTDVRKEFDSTWSTKDEANHRAHYLFNSKHGTKRLSEGEEFESNGLKSFWAELDDDWFWIVSVVPDTDFHGSKGKEEETVKL